MAKVIILGSSNAIPDKDHENTHMIVVGQERTVLIDCVSNPILRLQRAGVDFNSLTDLILTHFHPDHVSGVPLLLMNMWLMGRRRPLNVYGLHYTLDRVEDLMEFYSWSDWPNFFPVAFYRLPANEMTTVLDCPDFHFYASPVCHLIPTIGLRVEFNATQKVMAYSCDTAPCEQVVRLADGADVLIHEASGAFQGHSSAAQAADIARQAEVGALYLIHYPTGQYQRGDLIAEARQSYGGDVALAEDFMTLEF
ncbi:MAG: MBL fold metallo-hydrolase [Chloroflexi bacterium]|nr:MBL fold metallo-hydrolase [Chloroflexota bacterium]